MPDRTQSDNAGFAVAQGLLEDLQAERQVKEAEEIPEVDEHGKKVTKKQQVAAKKKAEAERSKQTQDEGTRIDPKASFSAMCLSLSFPIAHFCQDNIDISCAVLRNPSDMMIV